MAAKKQRDIDDLFNEIALLNYEIGSHFYAKPTYIIDPHQFYIMPFPFINHLASISKAGNPIPIEKLEENMLVIFSSKNPDVNKYFKINIDENIRGIIQVINEDKTCQIYALDRGFVEKDVHINNIFHPACEKASSFPSLVQHCELFFCAPLGDNFSQESIEAFKFYIGNEKLSVVVRGKSVDKLKIVVYNSNPDDIATLLALTHYTYLACTIRNDLPLIVSGSKPKLKYQHIELNVDDILTVRVQSGSSLDCFYVTPLTAYKQYLKNRADFTNHCKSLPAIASKDFRKGMLVGVQDDARLFYERAVILKVLDSETAKVKLVDWGTDLELPSSRIKPLKTKVFIASPASALYCSAIDGFVPWDNGLPKFLYKGYIFMIKVKKVGRGFKYPHIVSLAQT